MVLDGRVVDDGACVELGIAYALGKKIYGIKTDTRSLELDLDLNPLIAGCFTTIFRDTTISAVDNLVEFLREKGF
jgi:nucleoside 2-deoxyribosyltransferase